MFCNFLVSYLGDYVLVITDGYTSEQAAREIINYHKILQDANIVALKHGVIDCASYPPAPSGSVQFLNLFKHTKKQLLLFFIASAYYES